MKVTRNDVAKLAGVSTAVVSYVMNNGPRPVSKAARERVRKAIDDLGYRSNNLARGLRANRSRTVGVIVPDASNEFYSLVAKGIEEVAYSHSYSVYMGNMYGDINRQTHYVENLLSLMVDGIVYITLSPLKSELELLEMYNIPAVFIDPEGELNTGSTYHNIYTVKLDARQGGQEAAEHLLNKGHTHFIALTGAGHVEPQGDFEWSRITGFIETVEAAGCVVRLVRAGEQIEDGYNAFDREFTSSGDFTAVFAGNDLMALGVLRAAQDRGIRVPENLAVCGFDNISISAFSSPRLTTIDIPKYAAGKAAMTMLLGVLDGNPEATIDPISFPTHLVVREST
jgi:LacI family transcriptional regulator